MVSSIAGKIRIPNLTPEPYFLKRNEHFCQVHTVYTPEEDTRLPVSPPPRPPVHHTSTNHSANVSLDPNNLLPQDIRAKFTSLLNDGAEGPFEAKVNMSPVEPPQRKGRLPQYAHHQLLELQQKFDELEALGVFKRPEDINIPVEYLNPSFLVKKPSGGYRLVTAICRCWSLQQAPTIAYARC